MGAGDFTPQTVRYAFFVREREACFRCRRGLRWEDRGFGWSAHHRKPRGMGGTTDPAVAGIANCLIVCGSGTTGCHGWIEKNRGIAITFGLLIPRSATGPEWAPEVVRVMDRADRWWMLTASGRAVEFEEGTRV